jgi:hypothetical protein
MFFKKVVKSPKAARDLTAQCDEKDLTVGQKIVADYEMDVIALPCELAQSIDDAIKEAKNFGYDKAMKGVRAHIDVCTPCRNTW